MALFGRKLNVRIGPPGSPGRLITEEYRVTFNIEKTNGKGANAAQMSIYGLNADSRELITKEGNVIFIEAGYRNTSELLYSGALTRSEVESTPPDLITNIEAADGVFLLQDIKINLAFVENTPVTSVVGAVASQLGIPVVFSRPVTGVYRQGVAINATAREALDTLSKKGNFVWSIQDEQLQITGEGEPLPGRPTLLSAESGLLSAPIKLDDAAKMGKTGYRIISLMQPRIRPNSLIVINSRTVSGTFVVDSVRHRGDTYGQSWETEAEVYSVG